MRTNGKNVIAIDIDNTILGNNSSLLYYFLNKRPGNVSFGREITIKLDCTKVYKMSPLNKVFTLLNPKKFYVVEGAESAIDKLTKENTIILLSSRPYFLNSIKHLTAENLKLLHTRVDFVFVNCGNKRLFCKNFGVDYFVDDVYSQCLDVAKNKNVKVVCFDKKSKRENSDNVVCLNNWEQIFDYIDTNIKYIDKIRKNGDNSFLNYGLSEKFFESRKEKFYGKICDWGKIWFELKMERQENHKYKKFEK